MASINVLYFNDLTSIDFCLILKYYFSQFIKANKNIYF